MPVFDTGFLSPSANGTPATYDGSATEFTNPANAYSSDDVYATVVDNEATYKYQSYGNFGISLDSSYILKGMEIVVEGKTSSGVSEMTVLLEDSLGNFNGVTPGYFTTTEASYSSGGPTTMPPGTWTAAALANASFHVIARTGSANDGRTISLDHLKIKVYYDTGPNLSDSLTLTESVSLAIFFSTSIPGNVESLTVTDVPSVLMSTLAPTPVETITIEDFIWDINDGITYTRSISDIVTITEDVGNQSIRYGHGGRPKGTTQRLGT